MNKRKPLHNFSHCGAASLGGKVPVADAELEAPISVWQVELPVRLCVPPSTSVCNTSTLFRVAEVCVRSRRLSYRAIANLGLTKKSGHIIYKHRKGELAKARKRRAKSKFYQALRIADQNAAQRQQDIQNTYEEYVLRGSVPTLRKKAPSDR